jgi:hypothetical protein
MNAEQLHKTLVASQYAEQVLNLYKTELEQDSKDQSISHFLLKRFMKKFNKVAVHD